MKCKNTEAALQVWKSWGALVQDAGDQEDQLTCLLLFFFCSRTDNYGLCDELVRLRDDRMEKGDAWKVQNELYRKLVVVATDLYLFVGFLWNKERAGNSQWSSSVKRARMFGRFAGCGCDDWQHVSGLLRKRNNNTTTKHPTKNSPCSSHKTRSSVTPPKKWKLCNSHN